MSLWFGRPRASAIDKQLGLCLLDMEGRCSAVVGKISDSLTRFTTVVGHVRRCDDLFHLIYFMLVINALPVSMVPFSKGLLACCFLHSIHACKGYT